MDNFEILEAVRNNTLFAASLLAYEKRLTLTLGPR